MEYPQCLKSNLGYISDIPIMCAVLKHVDGTIQHVLERRQTHKLLGWVLTGPDEDVVLNIPGISKLPPFLAANNLRPFVEKYLQPYPNLTGFFRGSSGQRTRFYDYRLLPITWQIWGYAELSGVLRENQYDMARRCRLLTLEFATEGLRELINSVTGFVDAETIQDRMKLIVLDQPRDWELRFPHDFWLALEKLHGYPHVPGVPPHKHPFGSFLLTYVYSALDDYVVSEIQERSPYTDKDQHRRIHKLHQNLTDEGWAIVKKRLDQIWALVVTSKHFEDFKERFECLNPHAQLRFDFPDSEGRSSLFVVEQLAGMTT